MLTILFIGDISGKIGRQAVKSILPGLKRKYHPDFVIANAENAAHGLGVTEKTLDELAGAGIDAFTGGDHSYDKDQDLNKIFIKYQLVRPANFPPNLPGSGYRLLKKGRYEIAVINLIGRVFMSADYDCPFRQADKILANLSEKKLSAIIIDIHAEATSEKIALKHYLDGRITALIGTHTHIMTADEEITGAGTAYLTDVGMVGYSQGVIGLEKAGIINTFLTQIKNKHVLPEKGEAIFSAALVKVNKGRASSIKRISEHFIIK